MEYRRLGKTDLMASVVGLGCEYFNGKPVETGAAMMDAAMAGGVNIIDIYLSSPDLRSLIGEVLRGRRDKMIIQGHVGSTWQDSQYEKTRDLAECAAALEDLLTRLGTDYIDVGMLHYVDTVEDLEASQPLIAFMEQKKSEGVFKCLGFSSHEPAVAAKLVETGKFDVVMFSVNPLFDLVFPDMDRFFTMPADEPYPEELHIDPARAEFYRLCEARGVSITVMKSLAAGGLLDPLDSPFKAAMTVPQCIHYAASRPAVASVLVGVGSVDEVQDALSYCTASKEALDFTHIINNVGGGRDKRCMYCNHCLPCPAHIDVAAVTRLADEAAKGGEAEELKRRYASLEVKPSACVKCGACLARCPFGIDVVGNLEKAVRLFENA
ncbi:MAG TPA: aldo/keto reductase [Terriglobales bacterium]|nr:aldo/keto reductase [Terriglobales bacterium]